MEKTIYNCYVVMESQEQCDRMKQLCIDNDFVTDFEKGDFKFLITRNEINTFRFSNYYNVWGVFWKDSGLNEVTESEFIELLKTTK